VVDPCVCGRTHRRIARFSGRVDDMLVIRGVNVFPSAVEAALLGDPTLAGQYALVVDQREAMHQLEVHTELVVDSADREAVAARLRSRLEDQLRLRVIVVVGAPGSIPRQELGKAKRVFLRTHDHDELAAAQR
jgi:phenylacetate-CoA ligase